MQENRTMTQNVTPKFAYQDIKFDRMPTPPAPVENKEAPERRKQRLAPYEKMTADELIDHFVKSPEFRSEFGRDEPQSWQFALNEMYLYIFKNYPDSPLRHSEEQDAIITMFDDNAIELKMRIKGALKTKRPETDGRSHSDDFRSIVWNDVSYSLTVTQAQAVKCLWENWEKGCPEVSEKTIGEATGSDSNKYRLRDLFRNEENSPKAWKNLIIPGKTKGTFRLS